MLSCNKQTQEEHKMLKFQEDYSIVHQSFEDFILVVFVLVDDLYKKVAPKSDASYESNFYSNCHKF